MTCLKATRVAFLVVALGTLAASHSALAQQSGASAGTPQPSATTPGAKVTAGPMPQGFSVVLVLGDLQGTASTDDVPQAARKALTDMRDFLPYKSYKLLDAAWVMCCGSLGRRSNTAGGPSMRESTSVTQSLRGPEDQEYELQLRTSRNESGRILVSFELTAAGTSPLEKMPQKLNSTEATPRSQVFHESPKSIIDTSFMMDVGETVVVGTSRLKGGSKALIALLTAVPTRGSASARE